MGILPKRIDLAFGLTTKIKLCNFIKIHNYSAINFFLIDKSNVYTGCADSHDKEGTAFVGATSASENQRLETPSTVTIRSSSDKT